MRRETTPVQQMRLRRTISPAVGTSSRGLPLSFRDSDNRVPPATQADDPSFEALTKKRQRWDSWLRRALRNIVCGAASGSAP
jgi:hypothetical protein